MSVPLGPDENFKVFDENAEIALKEIGDVLTAAVPPGYGFVFLMSTFGDKPGSTFYTANIQRPDVINMMKEFIADQEASKTKEDHGQE